MGKKEKPVYLLRPVAKTTAMSRVSAVSDHLLGMECANVCGVCGWMGLYD